MPEHLLALKDKLRFKALPVKHQRYPETIIAPHLLIGNRVLIAPEGDGFLGLVHLARTVTCREDMGLQGVAVREGEV